ncbi:hypothetical protein EP607_04975 [Campylobacter upsaliensis]|nr:hypothetical protein [Campylobacter upsaliensis]
MLTLKLIHASQAHPTNALATHLCLTPPPFLCDLLYPHTRGKGNFADKPHKGFHKAQTTA